MISITMTALWPHLVILVVSAGLSLILVGFVLHILRHHAILDHPNDRSSHAIPTPRGGGWGVVLSLLPIWSGIMWFTHMPGRWPLVILGAVLLVIISWLDDLKDLDPRWRLLTQIIAVGLGMLAMPDGFSVTGGLLPGWIEKPMMFGGWVWFINLYNFMDGIDGITGTETASIGSGLWLLVVVSPLALNIPALPMLALTLAGVAIGFLYWNWHPAKVFMGDVGSVTLGYLVGWLLIMVAGNGAFWAALILPLYYCLDASLTLTRRVLRRQAIWQAHREHFYQRAVDNGKTHPHVSRMIAVGNGGLILCSMLATRMGWLAIIPAAGLMVLLLGYFRHRSPLQK